MSHSSPARVPGYRLHKPSGQARVYLDGRHVYLGKHGSSESREQYARLIAEQFAGPSGSQSSSARGTASGPSAAFGLSVNELLVAYLDFAEVYYSADGEPTRECRSVKEALKPLKELYGRTPAAEFGPKKLKALREHLVQVRDLSRKVVNARINRIRRCFKWAAGEELVPPSVFEGLRAVDGLRRGRSAARETDPVRPVPDADVAATLPHLSP
ncbi:MAG: recombinase XerD, partial [Planctomycetota bacterium]